MGAHCRHDFRISHIRYQEGTHQHDTQRYQHGIRVIPGPFLSIISLGIAGVPGTMMILYPYTLCPIDMYGCRYLYAYGCSVTDSIYHNPYKGFTILGL